MRPDGGDRCSEKRDWDPSWPIVVKRLPVEQINLTVFASVVLSSSGSGKLIFSDFPFADNSCRLCSQSTMRVSCIRGRVDRIGIAERQGTRLGEDRI